MKTLTEFLPLAIGIAVVGGVTWWLLDRNVGLGKWLLAALLFAHTTDCQVSRPAAALHAIPPTRPVHRRSPFCVCLGNIDAKAGRRTWSRGTEVGMRGFVIGLAAGATVALLWVIEAVRRNAGPDRAGAPLWPRPDGSVRSYGEVWDLSHGTIAPRPRRLPDGGR
jgi:hypothetical protein